MKSGPHPHFQELPGFSLFAVRSVAGAEAATKLVLHFGGRRVYVPQVSGVESVLSRVIGEDAVRQLADLWGGSTVAVPSDRAARRLQFVLKRSLDGWSAARIAEAAVLTERRVYAIRAQLREAGLLIESNRAKRYRERKS